MPLFYILLEEESMKKIAILLSFLLLLLSIMHADNILQPVSAGATKTRYTTASKLHYIDPPADGERTLLQNSSVLGMSEKTINSILTVRRKKLRSMDVF